MQRLSLLLCLVLIGASCAGRPAAVPDDNGSGGGAAIDVRLVHDDTGAVYIEGAVQFLQVTGQGVDITQRLAGERTSIALPSAGAYHLRSWARPCSGNCGSLDPPTDTCGSDLDVPEAGSAAITITAKADEPCKISLTG